MPALLSVNLNAVAVLRNRRNLPWPSIEHLARLALGAGASGITVHPRPDQRHIRFSDLPMLRSLTTQWPATQEINSAIPTGAELNIEGYPSPEFIRLVLEVQPDQVTLVPDDPAQNTSDHGWDFIEHELQLTEVVEQLHHSIKRVSLFADPDASQQQIQAAKRTGADRVELYTGPYGATFDNPSAAQEELQALRRTANWARMEGLMVNAGHDLTVDNLPALVSAIPELAEVSIGHALIADALEFGMTETVRRFLRACQGDIS